MTTYPFTKTHLTLMQTDVYCEYSLNDKPPLILIHGFVASSYTFNPIMHLLAADFSVIAIDLPGFGRSEKSIRFTYSYENYAQLIIACMDHFQLDKVFLTGHSMGGQIALYTARAIPDRIDKLVLISCSAYLGQVYKWVRAASYFPLFHMAVRRIIQKHGVRDTLENVLYDRSLITQEMIQEYGRPLNEKHFYKALTRLLRQREGDLKREQLQHIHTPTLLIWGEADNVVPLRAGKQLADDLPHAELISYGQAGHLITEELPDVVYRQILNWCLPEK